MPSFKTHFPIKGIRTDVTVTSLDEDMFAVELESADAFDNDKDPRRETISSVKEPNLIIQKTRTQDWVILKEGSFDLDHQDLKELGKAIEIKLTE